MRDMQFKPLWAGIGWLLAATIIGLSLMPHPPQPDVGFKGIDKLEHSLAYFALTGWFMQLYAGWSSRLRIGTLFVAMGVGLEFLQGLGGVRHFEVADMLANTTGVLLGLTLGMTRAADVIATVDRRLAHS